MICHKVCVAALLYPQVFNGGQPESMNRFLPIFRPFLPLYAPHTGMVLYLFDSQTSPSAANVCAFFADFWDIEPNLPFFRPLAPKTGFAISNPTA